MSSETNGPWRVVESRIAYENPWIRVRHDDVVDPNGGEGVYGVVETAPAVGIVAIDGDGSIVLVGQHRYPLGEYSWEIPEGAARDEESPLEAAQRELREETGLTAEDWAPLGTMATSNCIMNEVAHFFLATDLTSGDTDPDPTEDLASKLVPFAEAMAMVRDGRIQDAMSIVGLYRAEEALEAGAGR